jgi:hypothetical protein
MYGFTPSRVLPEQVTLIPRLGELRVDDSSTIAVLASATLAPLANFVPITNHDPAADAELVARALKATTATSIVPISFALDIPT